jgi:hypothetical protein
VKFLVEKEVQILKKRSLFFKVIIKTTAKNILGLMRAF